MSPYDRAGNEENMYDYLIVGAGFYGAVCAHELSKAGKKVLVVDKRSHIGGNTYTERTDGINVHKYGAHIFHTNDKKVWDYVNQFAVFNRYTNSPVANYHGEMYSLPFNMYTFNRMWGVITPDEARALIEEQKREYIEHAAEAKGIPVSEFEPENLEEQAISLVGTDIYEKLIRDYTMKQWGRPCTELPAFIIRRLPVRLTYDNNYFNALFQGIPTGGYTQIFERLLEGIEVRLDTNYLDPTNRAALDQTAEHVIYTGPIDAFYGYELGTLEYRSVRFDTEKLDTPNFQGNAVINYTDADTPFTRIIEHKWFEFGLDEEGHEIPCTIISREYSHKWEPGEESYYPVNDEKNSALYAKYRQKADSDTRVHIGGRLGEYRYYDMDTVISRALEYCQEVLK